jgi:hypothetical protein
MHLEEGIGDGNLNIFVTRAVILSSMQPAIQHRTQDMQLVT